MRICILNTFFPPWRGGAETYTYYLARGLSNLGHKVEVVYAAPFKNLTEKSHENCFEGKVKLHGLEILFWIYGVPITPSLPLRLTNLNFDIIHVNFPNPYNAYIGAYISALYQTPSVLTWHNDLPPVTSGAGALARIHDSIISHFYLKWYWRIIATTRRYISLSQILQRYKSKVKVIPNGVDCNRFNPYLNGNSIKAKHDLEGFHVVLFVGALTRWHKYKGVDVLIKAFRHVTDRRSDVKLLLVGDGDLKEWYEKFSHSLSLEDKVVFAGNVSDKQLPFYYAASDIVTLPSKNCSEGFGLVALEANASGKPVIASKVGGIPEVIIDRYNGLLLNPCDEKALADAILQLLDDTDLRLNMGKRGRKFAEAHDWKFTVKAVEETYVELLTLKKEPTINRLHLKRTVHN
jgi:glycosyltransferase involved in cell wall biosynthesis